MAADRSEELLAELAGLFSLHEPRLTAGERADLLELERRGGWRPGRRPARPEPKVRAFLDLIDRTEQEELTQRTLPPGSTDDLRRAFRERLSEPA